MSTIVQLQTRIVALETRVAEFTSTQTNKVAHIVKAQKPVYNWPLPTERVQISECLYNLDKKIGKDIGFIIGDIHSIDNEGRVGASGFDKTLPLEWLISMAHQIGANIIVKGGANSKWYLKKIPLEKINMKIDKQAWRDTSRCTMWIINWKMEITKTIKVIDDKAISNIVSNPKTDFVDIEFIPTGDIVLVMNKLSYQSGWWYVEESSECVSIN